MLQPILIKSSFESLRGRLANILERSLSPRYHVEPPPSTPEYLEHMPVSWGRCWWVLLATNAADIVSDVATMNDRRTTPARPTVARTPASRRRQDSAGCADRSGAAARTGNPDCCCRRRRSWRRRCRCLGCMAASAGTAACSSTSRTSSSWVVVRSWIRHTWRHRWRRLMN